MADTITVHITSNEGDGIKQYVTIPASTTYQQLFNMYAPHGQASLQMLADGVQVTDFDASPEDNERLVISPTKHKGA